jgi:hypothetical protein
VSGNNTRAFLALGSLGHDGIMEWERGWATMKRLPILVSIVCSTAVVVPLLAQVPYPPVADEIACRIRHDVKEVDTFADLPPSLQSYLQGPWDQSESAQIGFADRGAYYNESGTASKPGPVLRFIRGGVFQRYWYVFFEHGETITSHQLIVFAPDIDHPTIIIRAQPVNIGHPSSLCVTLDSIFDRNLR